MNDFLSLWRSPLDQVALAQAEELSERQPRCSCEIELTTNFDLMTIYNFGLYFSEASGNATTALTNMFGDMIGAGNGPGGAAFIPQIGYPVTASVTGITVADQCNVVGSGQGGKATSSGGSNFYHFMISNQGTFLSCNPSINHTSGGKYFRNLAFQWLGATSITNTCIAAGTWNCRAVNCTFTDCPTAFASQFVYGSAQIQGNGCTLEQCTIQYTQGPAGATAVILGGPQGGVIGPGGFFQTSPSPSVGGPTGCTCIAVQGPAEHTVISDMYLYEWTIGIDFSQPSSMEGSQYTHITNCEIVCWQTALNIQIPPDTGTITAGVKATSCTLAKAEDSSDGHPVVLVGLNGGESNNALNDVALVDCTAFSMAPTVVGQHGLEITGGSNIKIIGGTYSNNGSSGGAGIAISGGTDIQIIGANLQPSYPNSPNVHSQQYALMVSGSPGPILVSNCDMTGYGSEPAVSVSTSGTPVELLITGCPGYNDRGSLLSATSSMLLGGVSATTCSTPYFGPSVFTFSNAAAIPVKVFGLTITMSFGVIFLASPADIIQFTVTAPATFTWTGK
jgi:hypothetical protein